MVNAVTWKNVSMGWAIFLGALNFSFGICYFLSWTNVSIISPLVAVCTSTVAVGLDLITLFVFNLVGCGNDKAYWKSCYSFHYFKSFFANLFAFMPFIIWYSNFNTTVGVPVFVSPFTYGEEYIFLRESFVIANIATIFIVLSVADMLYNCGILNWMQETNESMTTSESLLPQGSQSRNVSGRSKSNRSMRENDL